MIKWIRKYRITVVAIVVDHYNKIKLLLYTVSKAGNGLSIYGLWLSKYSNLTIITSAWDQPQPKWEKATFYFGWLRILPERADVQTIETQTAVSSSLKCKENSEWSKKERKERAWWAGDSRTL